MKGGVIFGKLQQTLQGLDRLDQQAVVDIDGKSGDGGTETVHNDTGRGKSGDNPTKQVIAATMWEDGQGTHPAAHQHCGYPVISSPAEIFPRYQRETAEDHIGSREVGFGDTKDRFTAATLGPIDNEKGEIEASLGQVRHDLIKGRTGYAVLGVIEEMRQFLAELDSTDCDFHMASIHPGKSNRARAARKGPEA